MAEPLDLDALAARESWTWSNDEICALVAEVRRLRAELADSERQRRDREAECMAMERQQAEAEAELEAERADLAAALATMQEGACPHCSLTARAHHETWPDVHAALVAAQALVAELEAAGRAVPCPIDWIEDNVPNAVPVPYCHYCYAIGGDGVTPAHRADCPWVALQAALTAAPAPAEEA